MAPKWYFKRHITAEQIATLNGLAESAAVATDLKIGDRVDHDCAVVFLDLCNFTNISWTIPTETILSILQDLFEFATARIARWDGLIDKYPGDGVVAFFPRDYAQDNNLVVEQALDAVAEIMYWFYEHLRWRYDLPKTSHRLELAAGIDAGTISIAHVGSVYHSELILLGDQVNCASKCQQAATNREVVIGQDAAARVRTIYSKYFSTGPSTGVIYTKTNSPYRSFRFDWEQFAKASSWVYKS